MQWFTWEDNFRVKINEVREEELKTLKSFMLCNAFIQATYGITPTLVGVTTFLVHTQVFHRALSPATGFTAILLFNALKRPMEIFPDMVNFTIRCTVSYGRVIKFLETAVVTGLPKIDDGAVDANPGISSTVPCADAPILISLKNVTLAWNAVKKREFGDKNESKDDKTPAMSLSSKIKGCFRPPSGSDADAEVRPALAMSSLTKRLTSCFKKSSDGGAYYDQLDTDGSIEMSSHGDNLGSHTDTNTADGGDEESLMTYTKRVPSRSGGAADKGPKEVTILKEIDMDIRQGELLAIVGSTGSGKSTLLAGILGECKRKCGKVVFHEDHTTIAYVSQSSWIQNATVKDNILFGQPYDEDRYNAVLYACALNADLAQFADGDMTDIGEKGVVSTLCWRVSQF
jgi:ABC-type multidrug transport system fused ATPase/permease subunit